MDSIALGRFFRRRTIRQRSGAWGFFSGSFWSAVINSIEIIVSHIGTSGNRREMWVRQRCQVAASHHGLPVGFERTSGCCLQVSLCSMGVFYLQPFECRYLCCMRASETYLNTLHRMVRGEGGCCCLPLRHTLSTPIRTRLSKEHGKQFRFARKHVGKCLVLRRRQSRSACSRPPAISY